MHVQVAADVRDCYQMRQLHAVRGSWHFTALYSNTARAHQLGRVTDWVVLFFHKDSQAEGQRTVVTEARGNPPSMAHQQWDRGVSQQVSRHPAEKTLP